MQYLLPVGLGPSSKTWPKCEPHFLQTTSVRLSSGRSSTASEKAGSQKDGQPVPESNFVSEEKSLAPQLEHLYIPLAFSSQYFPENAGSVKSFGILPDIYIYYNKKNTPTVIEVFFYNLNKNYIPPSGLQFLQFCPCTTTS